MEARPISDDSSLTENKKSGKQENSILSLRSMKCWKKQFSNRLYSSGSTKRNSKRKESISASRSKTETIGVPNTEKVRMSYRQIIVTAVTRPVSIKYKREFKKQTSELLVAPTDTPIKKTVTQTSLVEEPQQFKQKVVKFIRHPEKHLSKAKKPVKEPVTYPSDESMNVIDGGYFLLLSHDENEVG